MEFESTLHAADILKKVSLPEGVTDQIFVQFRNDPMKYKISLKPENEKHCQFLVQLLQHGFVDFHNCTIKQLAPFDLGFNTKDAEQLLDELKQTRESQGESHAAMLHGEQNLIAVTSQQNQNSDPSKVAGFREELAKLTEKVGFDRTMFETLGRKAEQIHGQLFQSVRDHREQQILALRRKLQPQIEKFTEGMRDLYSGWNKYGAPLLKKISALDGATPEYLYYGALPLVMDSAPGAQYAVSPDLALAKLKRLQIHPVIRTGADGKRLEFALEEVKK